MIQKRCRAVTDFCTGGARLILNGELLNLLLTVLTHEMENPIRLGQGLIGTAGTF